MNHNAATNAQTSRHHPLAHLPLQRLLVFLESRRPASLRTVQQVYDELQRRDQAGLVAAAYEQTVERKLAECARLLRPCARTRTASFMN